MVRGRIPRLHEEIIDAGLVNGANGGVGVSIGRQERPLCIGENLPRLLQKADTIHVRHPLVRQQKSNSIVARLQLL